MLSLQLYRYFSLHRPFNQAQISPKDSQQEVEAIQPNIPVLLLNTKAAEAMAAR